MSLDLIWSTYNNLSKQEEDVDVVSNDTCNICGSQSILQDFSQGTQVCTNCGNILESSIMDNRAEWQNSYDESGTSKDNSRCGCPINPLLEKSSMSTMIKSNKYMFMKRLHNQMSMDYVERSRYHVFESINRMANDKGQLSSNVIEQAKYFYKILSERKLSRGVIRQGLIACCILYACKYCKVHRSIKEISLMTNVSIPTLNKTTKIFIKVMSDVLNNDASEKYEFDATESSHLISRFCNLLNIENHKEKKKFVRKVRDIDEELKRVGLMDCKTPSAITSGIIMYVCDREPLVSVNKTEISKLFNVSLVTINKIVKLIEEYYKNQGLLYNAEIP